MGDVVHLGKSEPHLSGEALCTSCRHAWVAVSPVGTDWLECPACGLFKGRYIHPAIPKSGEEIWECACGCDVFRITPKEAFCISCGLRQKF